MIKRLICFFTIAFFLSCNGGSDYKKAEDAQDAGRQFIRASLDGDYDRARFYILKNEDNLMLLDRWKEMYKKYSRDSIRAFREANIRPISIEALNDSTTLYTYSNSFTKDTTAMQIVRVNGEWLVDLKTFIAD